MNKVVASVIITLVLVKQGYIGRLKLLKEIKPVHFIFCILVTYARLYSVETAYHVSYNGLGHYLRISVYHHCPHLFLLANTIIMIFQPLFLAALTLKILQALIIMHTNSRGPTLPKILYEISKSLKIH